MSRGDVFLEHFGPYGRVLGTVPVVRPLTADALKGSVVVNEE